MKPAPPVMRREWGIRLVVKNARLLLILHYQEKYVNASV